MAAARDVVPTIVCVDDDEALLSSLREQLLRGLGPVCEIELASSGEEALALLAELAAEGARVPLLISDHIMPGLRGAQLLAQARAIYPDMLTVLLTGQADIDAVGDAVNGANLYRLLTKPWQEDELVRTVREALRRVEQERELARSRRALEHSLQLLRTAMDATADALLVVDRQGLPTHVNRQFAEMWGVPAGLALPGDGARVIEQMRSKLVDTQAFVPDAVPVHVGGTLTLADGRIVEYVSRSQCLNDEAVGTVFSFRDVTERQRQASLIRHQALHDRLSGLPNRYQFDDALTAALQRAAENSTRAAVLFVDLDHFKRINDTLGHDVGDELLKSVAERLGRCVRDGDLIARWGGDEFTVLLPALGQTDEAYAVARRILDMLALPVRVGGLALNVTASIGIAVYPEDGTDGATLLKRADVALYRVKERGRNAFGTFDRQSGYERSGIRRLALEAELRGAIAREELLLHYQPQVDTRSGRIVGVEALTRWQHPRLGRVAPDLFIPIAEQTGFIVEIGEWVLETACHQLARWREQGFDALRMAVNLSAVQFERGDLKSTVRRALSASGLPRHVLEVEITEAIALRHVATSAKLLQALRESGVEIALDDFGTGYSSLSHLRQLPCQTLKIDRSFVRELDKASGKDAAIVGAMATLGAGLGLHVVAEGVETQVAMQALQQLGVWRMQGYLFGHPMSAQQMTELLSEQRHLLPAQGPDSAQTPLSASA